MIGHNDNGYYIKDDECATVEYGNTLKELMYWYSQFEMIKIEEPNTNKVLLTLDENKELTINIKKADEAEVIYMLMDGLIRVCKEVEADQDSVIETIKELWGM